MAKFTKLPVTIEAFQWTGAPENPWLPWMQEALGKPAGTPNSVEVVGNQLHVATLEGVMIANPKDYIIQGIKGEIYPCKPDIFMGTYSAAAPAPAAPATTGLTFGQALEALQQEKKVARAGWNGKGMFIVIMPPLYLPPFNTQGTARKVNDRTAKWIGEDAPLDCQPYIAMYTATKQWQPGWLASQADMLATDWAIVA